MIAMRYKGEPPHIRLGSRPPARYARCYWVVLSPEAGDVCPLTRDRAKPEVPFGALYRIIDITLSNLREFRAHAVFVLTAIQSASALTRHVRAVLVAADGASGNYRGAAAPDASYRSSGIRAPWPIVCIEYLFAGQRATPRYTFILSVTTFNKMDTQDAAAANIDSALWEVSVATIEFPRAEGGRQLARD